jgi:hypothetical protein
MLDAREIGKMVLAEEWTIAGALERVAGDEVVAAITSYENVPTLIDADPNLVGQDAETLRKWLKPIGMANWPDMPNKGDWLSATLMSLSDLPAKIAISAVRQAVHRDFRFPSEVKPVIREIAAGIAERHRLALHRLKLMRAELERAANPQPQIEQQPMIWTQEEVDRSNGLFRKIGISTRYRLVGDDVEAFEKGEEHHTE